MFNIPVKFFPKDVISGKANQVGDQFTAFFLTGERTFVVTEHCGSFFMAEAVR